MADDARIIYDKYRIDIGDILEKFDLRLRTPKSQAKSIGEAVQVFNWGNYHAGEIVFRVHDDYPIWHDFKNFWSWASKGNPFTFARNKDKDYTIFLDGTPDDKEYLKDGAFEIWDSSTPPVLTNWTKTEVGSTTINKEANIEHLIPRQPGLACVKVSNDLSNISTLEQLSENLIPASAICEISGFFKSNDDTKGMIAIGIKNETTGNWWNGTSWTTESYMGTQNALDDDDASFGYGKARYRRFHFATFAWEATSAKVRLRIQNRVTGNDSSLFWFDDISFRVKNKKIPLQSTYGIAVDDYLWLQSREGHGEMVKVASISAGDSITCVDALKQDYELGDFVRYRDTYELIAEDRQIDSPMIEQVGLEFLFKMKVREYRTGRG